MREIEYNARSISPAELARSFIPPHPHFEKLLSSNHTLLIGPRGSGKTTLFKMLTVRGLKAWMHSSASEVAKKIKFNAAFVPADIAWGGQLNALDDLAGRSRRKEAAFYAHTIRALVFAMRDAVELGRGECPHHLAHLVATMTSEQESIFVSLVAADLGVRPQLLSLLGLELAIEQKLNGINAAPVDDLWSVDTLPSSLRLLISAFNGLIGNDDRRWALLFDELEIAPTTIKRFLIGSIRSFDERIIIKLAMAPFVEDTDFDISATSPHALHDFSTVLLTYANKDDAKAFTHDLTRLTFERFGVKTSSIQQFFERPSEARGFGRQPQRQSTRAIPQEFSELEQKDTSFKEFLKSRGTTSDAKAATEDEWAQSVRKILPIVILRNYYLKTFRDYASSDRSRKSYGLYTGFPSILELTEGNPRAILTMIGPMAQSLISENLDSLTVKQITTATQSEGIRRVEFLLTSLLRVIPVDIGPISKDGLLGFIDRIGRTLSDRVLKVPFSADYLGSFVVDDNTPPSVVRAIGRGLNAGALVHVPWPDGGQDSLLRGLRGQRFRLSYALAPRYRLLLTLGGHITLSKLLSASNDSALVAMQGSLFNNEDDGVDHR